MGTTSKEGSNTEVVRSGYAALNRRDPAAALRLLASSAEFRFRPPGGDEEILRGARQLAGFYDALFQIFDLVSLECQEIDARGDTVHVEGTVTLRVRESRLSTHAGFRHTYKLRDGMVLSGVFEDPVNPLELMRAATSSSPV